MAVVDTMLQFLSRTIAAGTAWCLLLGVGWTDQYIRFVVQSGDHPRQDSPLTISLPEEAARLSRDWLLWEVSNAEPVPVASQFIGQGQQALTWILAGETRPNTIRRFEFRPPPANALPPNDRHVSRVAVQRHDSHLEVRIGERPVLHYHVRRSPPPEGIDPVYGRSGHIHPVWTPSGQIVSDEFPPDHPHQDGIFLAYVKTEFEGRQPDFWNLRGRTGFVRCEEVISQYNGSVCGGFRVRHAHVDASVPDEKIALNEFWDVRVWQLSGDRGWRFVITSTIACATDSPLVLPQFHYGGMAFRGARSWVGDDAFFSTADGKTRAAGNHSRVPWLDLSGKTGDRLSGLTVFTDPANFRFPEPARLHPTMPYFVYTPSFLGDWSLEPGRPHVSRYHFHVHDGALEAAAAERIWHEISDPPRVSVSVVKG